MLRKLGPLRLALVTGVAVTSAQAAARRRHLGKKRRTSVLSSARSSWPGPVGRPTEA